MTAPKQALEQSWQEKGHQCSSSGSKSWFPTVDNLRNWFLTPMMEMLSFFQQQR